MPTWLIILLLMPPVLWVVYCGLMVFMASSGTKLHHITLEVAAVSIAFWLLWRGLVEEIAVFVAVGVFILCMVAIGHAIAWLVGHLERKRHRCRQQPSRASSAGAGETMAYVPTGYLSRKAGSGDSDAHSTGTSADADAGGFDI